MATLHARNVPDELYEALRMRAAREGRSIAAEAVAILQQALESKEQEARAIRRRFRLARRSVPPSERLGDEARLALTYAQQEAAKLRHAYLGTEHVLLGLLRDDGGAAAAILASFGVTFDEVRMAIAERIGEGETATVPPFPLTPRTKRVLELGLRQALTLGEEYVGSEHVLLGIVREREGVAAEILRELGIDETVVQVAMLQGPRGSRLWPALPSELWPLEYQVVELEGTADECSRRLNELAAAGWELEGLAGDRAVFRRRAERAAE